MLKSILWTILISLVLPNGAWAEPKCPSGGDSQSVLQAYLQEASSEKQNTQTYNAQVKVRAVLGDKRQFDCVADRDQTDGAVKYQKNLPSCYGDKLVGDKIVDSLFQMDELRNTSKATTVFDMTDQTYNFNFIGKESGATFSMLTWHSDLVQQSEKISFAGHTVYKYEISPKPVSGVINDGMLNGHLWIDGDTCRPLLLEGRATGKPPKDIHEANFVETFKTISSPRDHREVSVPDRVSVNYRVLALGNGQFTMTLNQVEALNVSPDSTLSAAVVPPPRPGTPQNGLVK